VCKPLCPVRAPDDGRDDIADIFRDQAQEKGLYEIFIAGVHPFRYRVYPFDPKESLPDWAYFSANMVYGIDSIGLYTPLMNRDYYVKLKDLGVVDDSMGMVRATEEVVGREKDMLEKLNVKYIISARELDHGFLDKIAEDNGVYLYGLGAHYPRFWFSGSVEPLDRISADIEIEEYSSGIAGINTNTYLVFSEKYYPGWKAYLDGKEVGIQKVMDIIQAVRVPSGEHSVVFRFEPNRVRKLFLVQAIAAVLLLLYGVYLAIRKIRSTLIKK